MTMQHPTAILANARRYLLESLSYLPLAILAATIVLFCLGAPRGFELTDESFYFFHYLYSRQFLSGATFFGLYFELPFALLQGNIAGIRIFGLALLALAGFYFFLQLFRTRPHKASGSRVDWIAATSTGISAVLLYYGYFTTLRAPSYNLLVLVCMLAATGALLCIMEGLRSKSGFGVAALLYGASVSVCTFAKPPAGAFLVAAHLLYFFSVNRVWSFVSMRRLALLILAGFAANVALVQIVFPDWLRVLGRGIENAVATDHDGLLLSLRSLSWDIQRSLASRWWAYLLIFGIYMGALLATARRSPRATSWLVVALTVILAAWILGSAKGSTLHPIVFQVAALLFATDISAPGNRSLPRFDFSLLALAALLFALPIGYSWGTNMPLASHSKMALVFPLAACLLVLRRLHAREILAARDYLLTLAVLCVPAFAAQAIPWFDADRTYRLQAPLLEQKYRILIGKPASELLVDAKTRDDLTVFRQTLASAGFVPGSPMLDFTGDGVGLVYAAGGRPLGLAWVLGGNSGSAKGVELVLGEIDRPSIDSAWLITSDDNPRRIARWEDIWALKIGEPTHRLAGTLCIRWPYRWGSAPIKGCYEVRLWKPGSGGDKL